MRRCSAGVDDLSFLPWDLNYRKPAVTPCARDGWRSRTGSAVQRLDAVGLHRKEKATAAKPSLGPHIIHLIVRAACLRFCSSPCGHRAPRYVAATSTCTHVSSPTTF